MEPDWDLQAVVRGFAYINKRQITTSASAFTAEASSYNRAVKQTEDDEYHRGGLCSNNSDVAEEELHGLYTPPYLLDPKQTQYSVQPTISSYLAALQAYKKKRTQHQHKGGHVYVYGSGTTSASSTSQTTPKPKRRKNHRKKICHVPAEALSSDVWSWRKYGQKPIKGSPFPRSYYKCSSSKTCLARKQVERNRSNPNMFIVTYTSEHNHSVPTHKNSLAGTTRNPNLLSSLSATTAHDESSLPTSKPSSTNSTATMSPGGSQDDEVLQQSKETEENMEFWPEMDVSDNVFGDLDDISAPPMDCFFSR